MSSDGTAEPSSIGSALVDGSRLRALADGEVLVAEGELADDVYVVTHGHLIATRATPYGEVLVSEVDGGDVVGDVTAIAGGERTATVRSAGPAEVAVVDRARLLRWLDDHPDEAAQVAADVRRRLDRTRVAELAAAIVGDVD
ncbi:MAG: Crp/Fnr family transcriptional regulator [Actinomycetota bacterium]